MFHTEIMTSMMQERARDLRSSASQAHDARVSRRARRFWAEQAAQQSARRPRRRTQPHSAAGVTGR